MDIRQLQILCALAQERHFGHAAERCAITQPTLSARLRQLEDELGIPIVNRGTRFEGFTAEGQRVLDWARAIIGQLANLRADVRRIKGGLQGTLNLGVIPTALLGITPLVQLLRREFPELRFRVRSLSTPDIFRHLDDHRIAAGVAYMAQVPAQGFRKLFLYEESYQLLFSTEHYSFPGESISWEQTAQLPLALLTPEMQNRCNIDAMFAQIGCQIEPVLETDSLLHIYSNVASGAMVGIVAAGFTRHLPFAGTVTSLPLVEPDERKAVGLISLDMKPESPFANAAIEAAAQIDFLR